MAMTNRELDNMEALRCKAALHWTERVKPDVEPPSDFSEVENGWLATCSFGFVPYRVERAWTTSISHGWGEKKKFDLGAKDSRRLYSSRLLALRAVRNQVEEQVGKILAQIDAEIEKERGNA